MKLSQEAINEFKRIYFKKFNIDLTDEEANRLGIELLVFFKLLFKPVQSGLEKT